MQSITASLILALCVVGFGRIAAATVVFGPGPVIIPTECPGGCTGKHEICGSGTGIAGCDNNLCETLQLKYAGATRICAMFAKRMCVCAAGYLRDYNGKCVRVENCPCRCNEHRTTGCGNSCGQTCDKIDQMCTMDCKPVQPGQCSCNSGYVRCTEYSSECVPLAICYGLKSLQATTTAAPTTASPTPAK